MFEKLIHLQIYKLFYDKFSKSCFYGEVVCMLSKIKSS